MHPMNPWPQSPAPAERVRLREFERLHEEWRTASAAADALECCSSAAAFDEIQRLLEYRLAAERAHQRAMQLLRDTPI